MFVQLIWPVLSVTVPTPVLPLLIRSTLSVTDEAAPTVSDAPGEVTSSVAAVIVVIPAVVPAAASPFELIIAVVVFEEFQVTEFVKS